MGKIWAAVIVAALVFSSIGIYKFASKQSSSNTVPAHVKEGFQIWKAAHNKKYSSPAEEAYRLKVFLANYVKVRSHSGSDYSLELNKFADLTESEFLAKYTGLKIKKSSVQGYVNPEDDPKKRKCHKKEAALKQAQNVDWRTQGVVNPVKDQGQCGSCWAFSANAAFESAAKINGFALYSYSEQELVDCSTAEGNEGCNGGWMSSAFEYVIKTGGLQTESTYPYAAKDQPCAANPSQYVPPKITGFVDIAQNDCTGLLNALTKQPVSVAVDATMFQFYTKGVFSNILCGTSLNHGVTAIGFGFDSSSNKNYWLIRNSWGTSWGEAGYMRIDRGVRTTTGLCGICMASSYPIVNSP